MAGWLELELEAVLPLSRFYWRTDDGDGAHMREFLSAYDRSYYVDLSYTWCEIQMNAGPG